MESTPESASGSTEIPVKSQFANQQVSFMLRAPQGKGLFWILVAVYAVAIIITAPFIVFVLLISSFPSVADKEDDGIIKGFRALWLWMLGLGASALVLSAIPHAKPENLSALEWWNTAPVEMGFMVAVIMAAIGVMMWHISWVFNAVGAKE